ncbi:MAG: hypothetical protein LBP62_00155 [Clostridiales bacterium]|jgi:DNA segregation ATPase FtsK/SpoIIIE-like protein|nr:hypothetical protein [Clostridiales bacterium]
MENSLKNRKSGASAGLISAFFFALVILVFTVGILPSSFDIVKDTILGIFGLAVYAYCFFVLLAAPALLFGKKIAVKKITLVKFALFFAVFLMLLHSWTAGGFAGGGFFEYCASSFESADTAGGLIFAVLTYHILAALGLPSAMALYGIILFGILLIIFIPYLKNGSGKPAARQRAVFPTLTEIKNGKVNPKPVVLPIAEIPLKTPVPVQRLPKVTNADGFKISYPNKPVDEAERRKKAAEKLFENADKKIAVDLSSADGADVITVKKTEREPVPEIDLDNYTNNGRRKILEENSRNIKNADGRFSPGRSVGEVLYAKNGADVYSEKEGARTERGENGVKYAEKREIYTAENEGGAFGENGVKYTEKREIYTAENEGGAFGENGVKYAEKREDYTAENGVEKERYGGDGEEKPDGTEDAAPPYAAPPSYLGANISDIRKHLKEEAEREKAEREAEDKKRREEEAKNADAAGFRPKKERRFGFFDDGEQDFTNARKPKRGDEKNESDPDVRKRNENGADGFGRNEESRTERNGADGFGRNTGVSQNKGDQAGTDGKRNDDDAFGEIEREINERNKKLLEQRQNEMRNALNALNDPKRRAGGGVPSAGADMSVKPESEDPREKLTEEPVGPQNPKPPGPIALPAKPIVIKPWEKSEKEKQLNLFEESTAVTPRKRARYIPPHIDLLLDYPDDGSEDAAELEENMRKLEKFFSDFKINATALDALVGPTFTRYEMQMPPGKPVSTVLRLDNDIAMRLASKKVRIEAPIAGKDAFGIEVPNKKRSIVGMRELVNDGGFYEGGKKGLLFTVGKDIAGVNYYGDITEMPHLLIAGSTGSGKSCCLNALIISLLYKYTPDELKMILIDPKQVELSMYKGIPHLLLPEPIVEDDKVINALDWVVKEMTRRYSVMKDSGVNNIIEFNKKADENERFYRIAVIVDEVAELMIRLKREFEDRIKSITQLARAAGIHVILATQRPSVDVITGVIKSNLPSRIAFAVKSNHDSQTILGFAGAEKLLGMGDMLFQLQSMPEPVRLQGVYISNAEINTIVGYIKDNNDSYFDEAIDAEINSVKETAAESGAGGNKNDGEPVIDPLFEKAGLLFIENGKASISVLQRRFSIGYARAARIVDMMEQLGVVGKGDGAKVRNILMTEEEFYETYGDMFGGDDEEQ